MATQGTNQTPRSTDPAGANAAWVWWIIAAIVIIFLIWIFSYGWNGQRAGNEVAPVNHNVQAQHPAQGQPATR